MSLAVQLGLYIHTELVRLGSAVMHAIASGRQYTLHKLTCIDVPLYMVRRDPLDFADRYMPVAQLVWPIKFLSAAAVSSLSRRSTDSTVIVGGDPKPRH